MHNLSREHCFLFCFFVFVSFPPNLTNPNSYEEAPFTPIHFLATSIYHIRQSDAHYLRIAKIAILGEIASECNFADIQRELK